MAYAGTLVSMGQGHGLVVATASDTEIGRIGALVGEMQSLVTPLTRRLNVFSTRITVAILVVATATFLYGHLIARMPALEMFLAVVGLAVAAIPEGLPAVVTIILAIGTRAMARNRAVVRRLAAVETLGSVTVICSDKTGTLTRNEMAAVRLVLPDREIAATGTGYAPEGGFSEAGASLDPAEDNALQNFVRCAALCNDAQLRQATGGDWQVVGDPTEGALITLARKADADLPELLLRHPRLDEIPFDSDRRFMATLHRDHEGHHVVMLKGAPERVLALCVSQTGSSPIDHPYWSDAIHRAASSGERVLALAQCRWPADRHGIDLADITPRFELLGLVGIIDPPREEAIAAVAHCQRAGIRVKMITGDHAVTASAIGRRLGLSPGSALTGDVIEALDDKTLAARAVETDVFARASPEHKLRLIGALQSAGHLVAMTGDGVNDAPALKAADIGVAMGHKGTDAAREASDLVLTDDNFATIARAVREGRVVFDNIRKSLLFMLPTNGGQAGVIVLSVFAGLALPVTAAQILWVNMVTAVTLALALAFEPAEAHVMSNPPRPVGEPLVTKAMATRILFVVVLMVAAAFAVFEWELARGSSLATARTAAVNMLVAGEVVYLFNVRHFVASAWRLEAMTGNRMALWVTGALVVLQLLFTYAAPLQSLFQSTALDLSSWLLIGGLAAGKFVAVEAEKALRRKHPTWQL
jgi:potassium/sodium efflux P-type ATPase